MGESEATDLSTTQSASEVQVLTLPLRFERKYLSGMRISVTVFAISSLAASLGMADINETTSRYLRTEYMCRVATEDGLKPVPAGLDHFRMTPGHYGVADLYGDGTIDFFFGFSDDTFDLDRLRRANERRDPDWPLEMFVDNAERSDRNHQYSFYSPDRDFVVPDNTRFLVARTFAVQDYNGDGIDDFAVAHFGRDYPPFEGRPNELFLSGEDGYSFSVLPGGPGQNHGATAGDIDNDGDVDLIISRGDPAALLFFENDGEGRFTFRRARGIPRQSYEIESITVSLWDVDNDGHLDLLASRRSDPFDGGLALIYWGRPGFGFEDSPTRIVADELEDSGKVFLRNGFPMKTAPGVLDFEFADFDGDGDADVALVSQSDFYRRWQVTVAYLEGRDVTTRVIDQSSEEANFAIFWVTACDLHDDGDVDLVYEHFGQSFANVWRRGPGSNTSRMERYVWLNDGRSRFQRHLLESPVYFASSYQDYLAANAEWLGVAIEGYLPAQVYFPNVLDNRERYLHPFYDLGRPDESEPYIMVPEIAARFPDLRFARDDPDASVARGNDGAQVSERVRAIIEARQVSEQTPETSGDLPEAQRTQAPERSSASGSASPRNDTPQLSPRAQAAIDAIRRGEDPSEAIADMQSRQPASAGGNSVARPSDPSQVSDRVRAIIEERRTD